MSQIQISKIGAVLLQPDWRYTFVEEKNRKLNNLLRSTFRNKLRITESDSSDRNVNKASGNIEKGFSCNGAYLKRFFHIPEVRESFQYNFRISPKLKFLTNSLTFKQTSIFNKIYEEFLEDREYGISQFERIPFRAECSRGIEWRLSDINSINDEFLKKYILHITHAKRREAIQFALDLHSDVSKSDIFRYLGYAIFLGLSDVEIAKRWNVTRHHIEAVRLLFFDFSCRPKEAVASSAYLRSMVDGERFTDIDFHFFKLLDNLGELGLKASVNINSITVEERKQLEHYLGMAMLENVLNLSKAVRTKQDASIYNNMVLAIGNAGLKQQDTEYIKAKTEQAKMLTRKIEKEVAGNSDGATVVDFEEDLLAQIREASKVQKPLPNYISITDLDKT